MLDFVHPNVKVVAECEGRTGILFSFFHWIIGMLGLICRI